MTMVIEAEEVGADTVAISDAFTAHWRHFGLYPGAELCDEDGVLWYRSPIRHLPYNAVIRTRIAHPDGPGPIIERICARFRELGLPFMWAVLPLDQPVGYDQHLRRAGLTLAEEATGMVCELDRWQPSGRRSGALIVGADGEPQIGDYELMIRAYWSLPEEDRPLIPTFNRYWTGGHSLGTRLVAYLDGEAVGKLFLNLESLPRAAVYGVAVVEAARGRGIAQEMMETAMALARNRGATSMVLHASDMGRPLYEKVGFTARCALPIYATEALFDTHHH
jgi:GNAT superfamily N-acetyltransferase